MFCGIILSAKESISLTIANQVKRKCNKEMMGKRTGYVVHCIVRELVEKNVG